MPWLWREGLDTASRDRVCCEPEPFSRARRNVDRSFSAGRESEGGTKLFQ